MSQRFDYVKYDEASVEIQETIKNKFSELEHIVDALPNGRAKSLVMTYLEEAYMWVGKAIRDDQLSRGSQTAHVPERG